MKNKKPLMLLLGSLFCLQLVSCTTTPESSSLVEQTKYTISYVESDYCDISLNKTQAIRNEIIEVEISNILTGYQLEKITANGIKIDGYSFIMPNENVEVEAHFEAIPPVEVPPVVDDNTLKVVITPSEYAVISADYEKCEAGTTVTINYSCKGTYILDYFMVNNEKISGKTFVMPETDAIIEGVFVDAIEETEDQTYCYAGGLLAKAYWYFNYEDTHLNIRVKVIDRYVCGAQFKSDAGYRDNIEFVLGKKTDSTTLVSGYTWKVLVSCDNSYFLQNANSTTTWGSPLSYSTDYFSTYSMYRYQERGHGYTGYEVEVNFAYSLLGLTREQAVGNLTLGLAMRNTINTQSTNWNFDTRVQNFDFINPSTHPVLLENGYLEVRS